MLEDLFGIQSLVSIEGLTRMGARLALDLVPTILIVRFIYIRLYRWNDYIFTYFVFNLITFGVCYVLRHAPVELGFALGLFAVFGILRYRTEPIRIRDLTYLFVVIGIAIINAVAGEGVSLVELAAMNALIVLATALLERKGHRGRLIQKTILYDNTELLLPGREKELASDLQLRTGLEIVRVEIEEIDLIRDAAKITIYCPFDSGALDC